jgi:phosphoglycerol transferase MdoB-like AlkP superfamily enzyme
MKSVTNTKPFYMNYWMFSVHAPFNAKEKLVEYYRNKIDTTKALRSPTYAAMVHSMDDAIGKLLDEVDRLGMADRTAIIFISDNGGNMYSCVNETTKSGQKCVTYATTVVPLPNPAFNQAQYHPELIGIQTNGPKATRKVNGKAKEPLPEEQE